MPVPLGNGDEIYDYITAQQLLPLESTRPIWEQIMAIEYLRLAQARDLICEIVPQKSIRQCRTDCWLVSTSKKKAADVRKILEAQTFKTIQRRTPFTPTPAPEHLTDDAPFRIIDLSDPEKLERHTLKLTYSSMSEKPAPMYPVLVPPPRKYVEGPDDVWAVARESLKNLQGILIHGGPGNGKSYMVDTLLKEVPEHIPVHRMSRTHVTARTIKGDTTSHWLNKKSKGNLATPCVIFVDELWLHEYNPLARLHAFSLLPDVCFICTGDELQLECIGNFHGPTEVPFEALGGSDMLKLMCPTQIELVEN